MTQYKVCNCPKCNHLGVSVAAMNYKETQQWHKSGNFSGSGIGIGTGGLGYGVGSGSYSETGEIATKRANTFSEPEPFSVPILHLILPLIISLIAINSLPMMMEMMNSIAAGQGANTSNINPEAFMPIIGFFNKYIAPAYGVFLIIMIFKKIMSAQKEEEHLNSVVYPKQLDRYNELRYCENCHTLYDHNNNAENANPVGMERMMTISPGL